ncbi:bifunctional diaminohydroxyphosphoribosylaminopyrimidine deaminase/5-amino-6-(5-phosphoribosylamino)uracil reductase RibD [Spongiivirga citrea]
MRRCLELAKKGIGNTYPNPSVGCVVVYDNKIIGEGFTSEYGGPHAEVNAIENVHDKSLLKKATLYVTLEPCSHFGKTPPCADLIIRHEIYQVVIGTIDLNQKVSGKGVEKLREAGCNVQVGCLEDECKEHHKRFLTYHNKKRPYIILKWAESADGFIAPEDSTREKKEPVWITNTKSRQLVHKWRSEEQAILVGTKTVLKDNPSLTTRDWSGKSPIRIVIDRSNKITKDAAVFKGDTKTIVVCENNSTDNLEYLTFEPIDFSKEISKQLCEVLVKHQILSVIIEGGSKTIQTFIDANLWDEARVFKGKITFKNGIKAPLISTSSSESLNIDQDLLSIYTNT